MLSNMYLVQYHNYIWMMNKVMIAKYKESNRIQILILDPANIHVVTTLNDVPLNSSK